MVVAIAAVALTGPEEAPTETPGADAAPSSPTDVPSITYVRETSVPTRLARWRACAIVDEVEPPGGCIRWATPLPAGLVADPVLAGDAVYVTGDGAVHAVSAATGAHRWTARLRAAASGPVSVDRATVVVGLRTGEVAAFGADSGLELWRVAVGGADILVDAEELTVAAIGDGGVLTGLDRVTGATRWRVETGIRAPTDIEIRDRAVRVGEPTSGLHVEFDVATGERTSPAVTGGGGNPRRPGPSLPPGIDEQVRSPTSVATAGGTLLVATDDGDIVAFDLDTQRRLWQVEVPGSSSAPFAIVARPGTVFAARGNAVVALGLPARPAGRGTPDEVWAQLRRPFQLPTHVPGECPVSTFADGLFGRAAIGEHTSVANLDGGGTVLFVPAEGYAGPLLVRGLEIDGRPSLRFRLQPSTPVEELQLDDANARYTEPRGARTGPAGLLRHWGAALEVPEPGCWVLQLDGLDFRDTIVFEVGPERGTTVTG